MSLSASAPDHAGASPPGTQGGTFWQSEGGDEVEGLERAWSTLSLDGDKALSVTMQCSPEGLLQLDFGGDVPASSADSSSQGSSWEELQDPDPASVPRLSVVMLVAGTRGDVQPFIALGLGLREHGHRVRLATHAVFREWVESFGLEFYPLGGDPKKLSDYIVRNRGVVPRSLEDLQSAEEVKQIIWSTYKACTEPDPEDAAAAPFKAQAIIANPPSYGHIHCAEALGVPLHMCFTMPWSPTREFASPLTHIPLPVASSYLNKASYGVVNNFVYSGMVYMTNRFRQKELGLEPIRTGNHGGTIVAQLKVPFMYCFSPSVLPKPSDWGPHIDVVGYFFLEEATLSDYRPPQELEAFLEAGLPPVYVGFGSLMVDNPERLTSKVVRAAQQAGVRLLIHKGWGGLGEGLDKDVAGEGVFLLEAAAPHDWLFQRCSCIIHHGGAGTTAAGLRAGRPTMIIPFFGDQHLWGAVVHKLGVGPPPVPVDALKTKHLVAALGFMHQPEVTALAAEVAASISKEDGVVEAVRAFHRHLPLDKLAAGERVEWHLSEPHVYNFAYEHLAGMGLGLRRPLKEYRKTGKVSSAVVGMAKGVAEYFDHTKRGLKLSAEALAPAMCGGKAAPDEVVHKVAALQGGAVGDGACAEGSTSSGGR